MFRTRFAPLVALTLVAPAAPAEEKDLADTLRTLDANVFKPGSDEAKAAATTLSRDVRARMQEANRRSTEEWKQIKTKDDWEKFRYSELKDLSDSLGQWPRPPRDLTVQVTGTIDGDGYRIEKIVFQSRPGLFVTANLYAPAKPGASMPGILIIHSHHNPKTQGELQDMGITWAKQGCLVLVPDQLGHGERRQHPFKDEKSFPMKFAPSRQDYYFRYNEAIQLHLVGESLIGWMVWDTMRGVDLLLSRPGIDPKRIALLGSVAGGGDPAAVTAALDPRITVVVPFNFGGPQPETVFPLPPDAETRVNWAGGGSWESTRNLRRSAADGFLPWVIVGAAAPRGLVYAHEFAWDRERDPVWKRLETIWGFYNAGDKLSETHGRGAVTGKPPEATHCNNIGPEHRKGIYPALKRWWDLPVPEKESTVRYKAEELACVTPEIRKAMIPLHVLAGKLADEQLEARRRQRATIESDRGRRRVLGNEWQRLLADLRVFARDLKEISNVSPVHDLPGEIKERLVALEVEKGVVVPLILLVPPAKDGSSTRPVVVIVSAHGKQAVLRQKATEIARLLEAGVIVCLPDVRGTGELRSDNGRGRRSTATSLSSGLLMLGEPQLGGQVWDLRSVIQYLRTLSAVDGKRIALWGTSLTKVNPGDRDLGAPLDVEPLPEQSEPLGGLLALFGGLLYDDVRAVYVQNTLVGYRSVLDSPFLYLPHDVVVPGSLTNGDLCDVAAALAPRPLRIEAPVDGLNRRVSAEALKKTYSPTTSAYAGAAKSFTLLAEPADDGARWLIDALKTK